MIEIKKEDNLSKDSFIDIESEIYKDKKLFKNKPVYLLHYPKGNKMNFSPGLIKCIYEDNGNIIHLCDTKPGSSGSPLINSTNYKVIGFHKVEVQEDKIIT